MGSINLFVLEAMLCCDGGYGSDVAEARSALNSRISGTGKGKPGVDLGLTLRWTFGVLDQNGPEWLLKPPFWNFWSKLPY